MRKAACTGQSTGTWLGHQFQPHWAPCLGAFVQCTISTTTPGALLMKWFRDSKLCPPSQKKCRHLYGWYIGTHHYPNPLGDRAHYYAHLLTVHCVRFGRLSTIKVLLSPQGSSLGGKTDTKMISVQCYLRSSTQGIK